MKQASSMSENSTPPSADKTGINRSKWIVAGLVVVMLGVAGVSLFTNLFGTGISRELQQKSPQAQARLEKLEIVSGATVHPFQIEVMRTNEERAKGLMFRQYMPQDRGMLFDFVEEQSITMWMRNTYLPLDMVFIKADGRIHRIHERAQPLDETTISSTGNVRYVLEINAGVASKLGLKAGDMMKYTVQK
jgi:uncharacterized protein